MYPCLFQLFDCMLRLLTSTVRGDDINQRSFHELFGAGVHLEKKEVIAKAKEQVADLIANHDITEERIAPFKRILGILISIMKDDDTCGWEMALAEASKMHLFGYLGSAFMDYLGFVLIKRMLGPIPDNKHAVCAKNGVCPFVKKAALSLLRDMNRDCSLDMRDVAINHIERMTGVFVARMGALPDLLK